MLVPEDGKKLVHNVGKVVASNVVYVKEASMASDWAELDIEEAEQLKKQWRLEEKQSQESEAQQDYTSGIEEEHDEQLDEI